MVDVSGADVNGDGVMDAVALSSSGGAIVLQSVTGSATTISSLTLLQRAVNSSAVSWLQLALADVDVDGDVDAVAFCRGAACNSTAVVLRNVGGVLSAAANVTTAADGTVRAALVVDCDSDGDVDALVFCDGDASSTSTLLVRLRGSGSGLSAVDAGVALPLAVVAHAVAADVDGDGDADVVVRCSNGSLWLLRNSGSCAFATSAVAAQNASAVAVGDMDMDGDADVVVRDWASHRVSALVNDGSGAFTTTSVLVASAATYPVSTSLAVVDVDGDGDGDVPSVLFRSVVADVGVTLASLSVRVLGRGGVASQAGVTVCVAAASLTRPACAIVSDRTPAVSLALGPVTTTVPYGVEVVFTSGRRHTSAQQAALGGVVSPSRRRVEVLARDVPVIAGLTVVPVLLSGAYVVGGVTSVGIGGALRFFLTAAWNESALVATSSGVTVNGRSVASSLVNGGGGAYTVTYVVAAGIADVAPGAVAFSLALADGVYSDAVSDAVTAATHASVVAGIAVDASPPTVTFLTTCGPLNGSVSGNANETLCVSCDGEAVGCRVSLSLNGSAAVTVEVNATTGFTAAVSFGPLSTGTTATVRAIATDAAGNVGPAAALVWDVELETPVTQWLPGTPPPLTNNASAGFSFGCSRSDCRFRYSLDNSALLLLGPPLTAANASSVANATDVVMALGTVVNSSVARVTPSTVATFNFTVLVGVASGGAVVNASVVPLSPGGGVQLQVRLDGAVAWTFAQLLPQYNASTAELTLASLPDGEHTLEARAWNASVVDATPWLFTWRVDTRGPLLALLRTPPASLDTPSDSASFVVASGDVVDGDEVAVSYRVGNTSAVASLWSFGPWLPLPTGTLSLADLTPGVAYRAEFRGTDAVGNVGNSSVWEWRSAACAVPAAWATANLTVVARAVDGVSATRRRAFSWVDASDWRFGFEFVVDDDAVWSAADGNLVVVVGAAVGQWHTLRIRARVPAVCSSALASQRLLQADVSWFEWQPSPGVPGIASAPLSSTFSTFAAFEFNATATPAWFQYSLDNSSWAACARSLSVGPLDVGRHTLAVRTVDVNSVPMVGQPLVYTWAVVPQSAAVLQLTALRDGPRTLTVTAFTPAGLSERRPRLYAWVVDTVAPSTNATLLSPATTNTSTAQVLVGCLGESDVDACAACVSVRGNVSCSMPGSGPAARRLTVTGFSTDGVASVDVAAVDGAGNVGPYRSLTWLRDTVPPALSTTLLSPRCAANTTANASADSPCLVPSTAVVIAVTAGEPLSSLRVVANGTVVWRDDTPSLSLNVSLSLPDGTHTLRVLGTDVAGNEGVAGSLFVGVDTVAPVTLVASPPAALSSSRAVEIGLAATGERRGTLRGFRLAVNATTASSTLALSSFVAAELGNTTATAAFVVTGSGRFNWSAAAEDVVGHVDTVGVAGTFVVDVTPPTSTIAPVLDAGAGIAVGGVAYSRLADVVVTAGATDDLSPSSTSVRVDGGVWQLLPPSVTQLRTRLPDGLHAFEARSVDAAGNVESPPYPTVYVVVDTTPPSLSFSTPPPPYANELPGVEVCGVDANNVTLAAAVTLNGLPSQSLSSVLSPASACTTLLLGVDGIYNITVNATDNAGNTASPLLAAVVLDRVPPSSWFVSSSSLLTNRSTVGLVVNGTDAASPLSLSVRRDTGAWVDALLLPTLSANLPDGTHTFAVRATDAAGNVQPPPYATVTVRVDTVTPAANVSLGDDTLTPSALAPGVVGVSAQSFAVVVSPSEPAPVVRVVVDGVVRASGASVSGERVTLRVVDVADGWHTLALQLIDEAGNGATALNVSLLVDTVAPAPTIVAPQPAFNTSSASLVLAVANDAATTLTPVTYLLTCQSSPASACSVVPRRVNASTLSASTTLSLSGLRSATYRVTVDAVDAVGNAGVAANVSFVVDLDPPSSSLATLPALVNTSAVLVSVVTVDALSPVTAQVRVDAGAWHEGAAASSGVATSVVTLTVPDGRHVVECRGVDAAGNTQPPPYASTSLVVDTAPPSLSPTSLTAVASLAGCRSLPGFAAPVCNASSALHFTVACDVAAETADASLCRALWLLRALQSAGAGGGCSTGGAASGAGGSDGSGGVWQPADAAVQLPPLSDGRYLLLWRVVDDAGNVGEARSSEFWLDTARPLGVPQLVSTPDKTTFATTALFEVRMADDGSPGRLAFLYAVTSGRDGSGPVTTAPLPEPTNSDIVQIVVDGLAPDESYSVSVWAQDHAGFVTTRAAVYAWYIVSVLPTVTIVSRPAAVSALRSPMFVFAAEWAGGASSGTGDASFRVSLVGVTALHSPCDGAGARGDCASWCNATRCEYSLTLDVPGSYTFQVQALVGGRAGPVTTVLWEYHRCSSEEFAVLSSGDAVMCRPCPGGADCSTQSLSAVMTQRDIVAQAGYWASPDSDGSRFYRCPLAESCLRGSNGTRSRCAVGYAHVACSQCADGFFEQFGTCVACPSSSGSSVGVTVGLVVALSAALSIILLLRHILPVDVIKVGVSMVQIIASANSAYAIPWPPLFSRLLLSLRLFLIDVASITQLGCSQPVTFYTSLCIVLLGLKLALALLLLGPWLWQRLQQQQCRLARIANRFRDRQRLAMVEVAMVNRRRGSVMQALADTYQLLQTKRMAIDWGRVFKVSFMLLFLAYPGVSVQILRMFKCRRIEGHWLLVADLRLRCFDARWYGFAVYAAVMGVLYVVGLPATVLWILWRRRHKLFGAANDSFVATTRDMYGFLYVDYGSSAWWWEAEELLRKLLLTAVVVVIDEGSPLQVTLAVLVSGWAHVLHAQYKPWGAGSVLYRLQHGSLLVTSFVFLMGLLFKVQGVTRDSGMYTALSVFMMTLCIGFMLWWASIVLTRMVAAFKQRSETKRLRSAAEVLRLTNRVATPRSSRVGRASSRSARGGDDERGGGGGGGGGGGDDGEGAAKVDAASSAADAPPPFSVVNPLRVPGASVAGTAATSSAATLAAVAHNRPSRVFRGPTAVSHTSV